MLSSITWILVIAGLCFSYPQSMHQYITREAFKLLEKSFPGQLSEMAAYVGTNETQDLTNRKIKTLGMGNLVSGAWIEDEYDVVSCYGIGAVPKFDQTGFGEIVDATDNERRAFTCVTHFWDADAGLNASTTLTDVQMIYGAAQRWSLTVPENSCWKIRKYGYGGFNFRKLVYNPPYDVIDVNYPNGCHYTTDLLDEWWPSVCGMYRGETAVVIGYHDIYSGGYCYNPKCKGTYACDKSKAYEILGRMCHLLQDMAVPEHAHNDSHAGRSGMRSSYYEDHCLGYHQWTADELYWLGLSYVNPYFNFGKPSDPLYSLMYFLNQIADHYASASVNGDDAYDPGFAWLKPVIPLLGSPKTTSDINETTCSQMHDVLQPYAIRATAGLLYWFLEQTGQVPFQPLNVTDVTGALFHQRIDLGIYTQTMEYTGCDTLKLALWIPVGSSAMAYTGKAVTLKPGFWAVAGSNFSARIDPALQLIVPVMPPPVPKVAGGAVRKVPVPQTDVPAGFDICQNVPNPFNPSTLIRYQVPRSGSACSRQQLLLRIYDASGRVVKTLENGCRLPGTYSVEWDGTNERKERAPAGMYFCHLRSGRFNKSIIMILGK